MNKKHLYLILLIIGTAFWGISYAVTKIAVGHTSASTFLFYRFLGATLVLAVIFRQQYNWRRGAMLAVPLVLNSFLITLGIKYTSASQAAFLTGTCVVIVPALKLLFFRTAIPFKTWLAGGIALVGLSVICLKDGFRMSTGDLYTIGGTFIFSLYLIQVEKAAKRSGIISSLVPMFAMCTVIAAGIAMGDTHAVWVPAGRGFWVGIVYCALFSTAYMYTVSNLAQRYINSEKVAIIYLFEPVFGATAAYFIVGEALTWRLLSGGILIFVGTLISEINFTFGKRIL